MKRQTHNMIKSFAQDFQITQRQATQILFNAFTITDMYLTGASTGEEARKDFEVLVVSKLRQCRQQNQRVSSH